ncbi:MAG: hypothetical protein FJ088_16950, partial [Deltaproteobacteria bacterium]|nr:hypothetical protein [Deltaproteobacteria bacterium]
FRFVREELESVFRRFTGEILQSPQKYSAVKKEGRPLYYYARKGIEVEIKPRPVTIHEIVIEEILLPDVLFRVRCGKGVYIRSLAQDIGLALGCGAVLTELRRLGTGGFSISDAVDLETCLNSDIGKVLLEPDNLFLPP